MEGGVCLGVRRGIGGRCWLLGVGRRGWFMFVFPLSLLILFIKLTILQVIHLSASRRAATLLALDPHPSASDHPTTPSSSHAAQDALQSTSKPKAPAASKAPPHSSAVVTVSWAPSCGRSYHLVATGGRDGHIRIWKLKPESDDDEEGEGGWSAGLVADFEDHGYVFLFFGE